MKCPVTLGKQKAGMSHFSLTKKIKPSRELCSRDTEKCFYFETCSVPFQKCSVTQVMSPKLARISSIYHDIFIDIP